MFLVLTDISGKKVAINPKQVRLVEADNSGGTHISFGADQGRVVKEQLADVINALGAVELSGN